MIFWTLDFAERGPINSVPFGPSVFRLVCDVFPRNYSLMGFLDFFAWKHFTINTKKWDFWKFISCLENCVKKSNFDRKRNIWCFNLSGIIFSMQILHKHMLLMTFAWSTHNHDGILFSALEFEVTRQTWP